LKPQNNAWKCCDSHFLWLNPVRGYGETISKYSRAMPFLAG
jgi:hypothetical protein